MKQRVIYVFTHDSIGLGEDGPTHQPVEQTATLRLIPNMDVWRPCDTVETHGRLGLPRSSAATARPARILSRQNLPFMARDAATLANIAPRRLRARRMPARRKAVIIATGSEVELALKAQGSWPQKASPCASCRCRRTNIFDRQDAAYKDERAAEGPAARRGGSRRHRLLAQVRRPGRRVIGIDRFGESAPAPAAVQGLRLHRWRTS